MKAGGRTPEELDTLLEDAFVTRDAERLCSLFADGGVLARGSGVPELRGGEAIGRAAAALWDGDRTYVAGGGRVLRARDTALLVSPAAMQVARRGDDGAWRLAICLLHPERQEDA